MIGQNINMEDWIILSPDELKELISIINDIKQSILIPKDLKD